MLVACISLVSQRPSELVCLLFIRDGETKFQDLSWG